MTLLVKIHGVERTLEVRLDADALVYFAGFDNCMFDIGVGVSIEDACQDAVAKYKAGMKDVAERTKI